MKIEPSHRPASCVADDGAKTASIAGASTVETGATPPAPGDRAEPALGAASTALAAATTGGAAPTIREAAASPARVPRAIEASWRASTRVGTRADTPLRLARVTPAPAARVTRVTRVTRGGEVGAMRGAVRKMRIGE
jgi:hypothetical protein